ncbi:GNAT family N-acetyltransferase [Knoellia subterranea]|uniref:GNAT family N-acetyltransferase n=1 Tax=Knoellia subterranea TaxID=184882 RepID=UPI001FE13E63|nr:GNAT family N-acetyltransferase [Knoellia subterranea]
MTMYGRAACVWVVNDGDREGHGDIAGYLLADVVDGAGHIEQVSVDPGYAGQRIGRALIDEAARWATTQGYAVVTLTTFTRVPWNAPYYERLGFVAVPPEQLGEGLRRVREHEADLGLDRWPRTAMARPL